MQKLALKSSWLTLQEIQTQRDLQFRLVGAHVDDLALKALASFQNAKSHCLKIEFQYTASLHPQVL